MIEVIVARDAINFDALTTQLRSVLGELYDGLSGSRGQVIVRLKDKATSQQVDQARAIVQAHDPAVLTAEQQVALDREQKLNEARRANKGSLLDVSAYEEDDPLIQALAQKLAWIEREMIDLRGGM